MRVPRDLRKQPPRVYRSFSCSKRPFEQEYSHGCRLEPRPRVSFVRSVSSERNGTKQNETEGKEVIDATPSERPEARKEPWWTKTRVRRLASVGLEEENARGERCDRRRHAGGKTERRSRGRGRRESRRDGEVLRGDYQEAERTPMNTEILPIKGGKRRRGDAERWARARVRWEEEGKRKTRRGW